MLNIKTLDLNAGLSYPGPPHQTNSPKAHHHHHPPSSSSPWKPARPSSSLKQEEPEIQVIESEDEEEEVLVDDFDGQCCRTYPYNHSKIQRWREGRKEKKEKERKENVGSKHLAHHHVQSVKTPTSNSEKSIISSGNKQNEPTSTAAGSIPVGIVSARQRTDQEKQPPGSACSTMPLPPSGPLVSTHGGPPVSGMGPSTWSSGPPPPWAMAGQAPPGAPPGPSPYGPAPPWAHPAGMPPGMAPPPGGIAGPIPMGYQLAKDPMTGQILLIPTDHMGQPPPATPGFGFGGMPPGMPPTSSASQHLHHLMMQQQHMSYMQHQDLMQQQLRHGIPPNRPRVPETITVSDDDDEDCGKEKASKTESEVVPSAGEPSNLTKESRPPTPLQIKREIVKTEFKTEPPPIPSEPYEPEDEEVDVKSGLVPPSQGVSLVDKAVTIKQERQERGSLSAEEAVVVGEPSIPAGGCEIQPALCPTDSPHTAAHPTAQQLVKREIKCEVGEIRGGDGTLCEDTKLCAEALLFMSERSTPSTCNEHFAPQLQEPAATDSGEGCEGSEEHEGFEILFKGLQMLAEGSVTADQLSPIQTLTALAGLDLLCSVTRNDTFEYGLSKTLLDGSRLNLGLLCAITAEDYENHLNWVDPVVRLKKTLNVKKYPNQASEKEARDFISKKIKQFTKDHPESLEEEKYDNIKMLAKMVKKIKNMEIMSQLEVDMRLKITELQNTFREKQKCLSKLKTPRKNKNVKNKKGKQRGPGRPKKKKFPNPKAKMGRPRKHPKVVPKMEPLPVDPDPLPEVLKLEKIKEEEREEEEEEEEAEGEEESFPDSDAPPILEPQKHCDEMKCEGGGSLGKSSLLKPPKLTASSPPPHSHKDCQSSSAAGSGNNVDTRNTTLSTLTSKFMKGKANPFANLLSQLAAPPSASAETDDKEEGEEEEEADDLEEREGEQVDYAEEDQREDQEGEEGAEEEVAGSPAGVTFEGPEQASSVSEAAYGEVERSSSEKSSDDSSSETGSMMSPTRDCSFQFGKTSKLGYGLEAYRHSKKRKADKPKKHSGGSSETIVPKKPKNLFMMMDFQRGFNAKSAEDEYNFDENDEEKSFEYREPRKESPTPSAQLQQQQYSGSQSQYQESQLQYQEWTDEDGQGSPVKRKHKKSKSSKSKSSKKERQASGTNANSQATAAATAGERLENLRSAQLKPSDLKDGLRLLMLQEGKFWPARLNSTKLPDVYGVVMDRQRGNRPIILPRDDILKEAVLEIRPTAPHHLPIGARVCTLWSSALAQLFPGTITTPDEPLPEGHVLVELDDGDSRLVEMSKIRMLPTDYSRVVYDPDPIASLRKRRVSTDSHDSTASHGELRSKDEQIAAARKSSKLADNSFPSEPKKKSKNSEKMKKKHKKCSKHGHHHCHKHKHKRHKSGGEPVASGSKKTHDQKFAIRSPPHPGSRFVKSDQENNESSEEASHEESDQQNSSDEEGSGSAGTARPTHHELTPQKGRELWQWSGEGYRRPGGKGKSKKLFFRSIQRGKDSLHVNDCAVFLSTGRSDRPYIGKIEMLWETGNGSMMVKVKWFYHPEEIETCGRKFDLKLPGGLFQSPHTDENSVHTISHECEVLPIKEYSRLLATESKSKAGRVGALYYLAGSYDPAGLTVHFQPGVLQSNSDSE